MDVCQLSANLSKPIWLLTCRAPDHKLCSALSMLLCLGVKSEGHCCKGTLEKCICCHIAGTLEPNRDADYCLHAERQEQLEREIEKRRHDLSVREAALADAERASERKWRDLSRELHDKVRQPRLCWKFDWVADLAVPIVVSG